MRPATLPDLWDNLPEKIQALTLALADYHDVDRNLAIWAVCDAAEVKMVKPDTVEAALHELFDSNRNAAMALFDLGNGYRNSKTGWGS